MALFIDYIMLYNYVTSLISNSNIYLIVLFKCETFILYVPLSIF